MSQSHLDHRARTGHVKSKTVFINFTRGVFALFPQMIFQIKLIVIVCIPFYNFEGETSDVVLDWPVLMNTFLNLYHS